MLRNSDLVMWDDRTESLWQQIGGEAIIGELVGTRLTVLPASIVSWDDFVAQYPEGIVLAEDQGFGFAYGTNPYRGYSSRSAPIGRFVTDDELDERYPALERVVGVEVDGEAKAFPFSELSQERVVNDELGGEAIVVLWGSNTVDALDEAQVVDGQFVGTGVAFSRVVDGRELTLIADGDAFRDEETGSTWSVLGRATDGPLTGFQLEPVIHTNELWFAWSSFNPDGAVFQGPGG